MSLENVKVGDKLIMYSHRKGFREIKVVTRRTPKRIKCTNIYEFSLTGRGVNTDYCVRLPRPGEIEELEAKARKRQEQQAAEAQRRGAPEYRTASWLLSMSEEELVERLGAKRLAQINKWLENE